MWRRRPCFWRRAPTSSRGTPAALRDHRAQEAGHHICAVMTTDWLIRYRDGTHITVPRSEALTSEFTTALAD